VIVLGAGSLVARSVLFKMMSSILHIAYCILQDEQERWQWHVLQLLLWRQWSGLASDGQQGVSDEERIACCSEGEEEGEEKWRGKAKSSAGIGMMGILDSRSKIRFLMIHRHVVF